MGHVGLMYPATVAVYIMGSVAVIGDFFVRTVFHRHGSFQHIFSAFSRNKRAVTVKISTFIPKQVSYGFASGAGTTVNEDSCLVPGERSTVQGDTTSVISRHIQPCARCIRIIIPAPAFQCCRGSGASANHDINASLNKYPIKNAAQRTVIYVCASV